MEERNRVLKKKLGFRGKPGDLMIVHPSLREVIVGCAMNVGFHWNFGAFGGMTARKPTFRVRDFSWITVQPNLRTPAAFKGW